MVTRWGSLLPLLLAVAPAEMPVTVPVIVIGVSVVTPTFGALTVVLVGPMPYA